MSGTEESDKRQKLTQLDRKVFEVVTLFKQHLKVVPDEVDALLEKFLQDELVGESQDGHTVGEVEVAHHELHTARVELLGLEVVGGLQEVLHVVDVDVRLAGVWKMRN